MWQFLVEAFWTFAPWAAMVAIFCGVGWYLQRRKLANWRKDPEYQASVARHRAELERKGGS